MPESRDAVEGADALIVEIARGSEKALRSLYRAVHPRVYAFALKRLHDPFEAAEVANEVMLEVWRGATRYEARSRALTWILGIAHHKVIDLLRRRRLDVVSDDAIDIADDGPEAHEALAGAENAEWLRHCLEKLSDAHRTVVHLAFFEDLGYPEIAEIIDCPLGTVKTRMFHARRQLKECLATMAGGAEALFGGG